jgi:hypothetical protein
MVPESQEMSLEPVLLFLPAIYLLQIAFTPPHSPPPENERQFEKKSTYAKAEKLVIIIWVVKSATVIHCTLVLMQP